MTLLNDRPGGSSVYAHALSKALTKRDDVEVEIISAPRSGGIATLGWMASGAVARTREVKASLIHSPAFLTPFNSPIPVVLTIHDLSLGKMPEGHPLEWRMYYHILVSRLARRARFILTPTETTRQDVISTFAIPAERIVVTPSGVDEQFLEFNRGDDTKNAESPLIVFPGPPMSRKNLDIVLRALGSASPGSALSKARVEITGASAEEYRKYQRQIDESKLTSRVAWLGKLRFEDMPALYSRADVLVYPSFLEGFGFPPLEAMAVGTPVVASNASCLPEVLGNAALLVGPNDDASFASAVESVLTDNEVRRRLIEAGSERAHQFTWNRCAELTAAVYKRVVSGQ